MKLRRHTTFNLLLFLLAGAIINVAVSSVLAVRHPEEWDSRPISDRTTLTWADWPTEESFDLTFMPAKLWTHRSAGCTVLVAVQNDDDDIPIGGAFQVESGWPLPSMTGQMWCLHSDEGPPGKRVYRNAVEGDRFGRSYPAFPKMLLIPLKPIFPGFAVNTIFNAAVLWMLFAAPFALRRWRRIKRGQCASCGYSLRGTPDRKACPECGATA